MPRPRPRAAILARAQSRGTPGPLATHRRKLLELVRYAPPRSALAHGRAFGTLHPTYAAALLRLLETEGLLARRGGYLVLTSAGLARLAQSL